MKKFCFILSFAALALAACTKKTTNTTIMLEPKPAYIVSGVHDVSVTNGNIYSNVTMQISVLYNDSDQYAVNLSLSALPTGIAMDTTWSTNGIPSYSTLLTLYDTTAVGATPGNYPMTLTATSIYGKKTYPFNLRVNTQPSCTSIILGTYSYCYGCTSNYYTDIVTADVSVPNKIWFSNFNNSGQKVYGMVSCSSLSITIPNQTIGGISYHGSGYIYSAHYISGNFYSGTNYCSVTMN